MPEIARYALKTKVLVIVADNMDLLLFDGEWKYWSARSLNVKTLTATEYSRIELRSTLNLNSRQLAILGTIAGNDVIPFNDVHQFHVKLKTNYKTHFYKLADYVRELPLEITFEEIKRICEDIYGSTEFVDQIKISIDMYNITDTVDSSLQEEQENDLLTLSTTIYNEYLYGMVKGLPIKLLVHFTDLRRTDFVPYFDLVKPILQRSVGVVRSHISDMNYMQEVLSKVHHNKPYTHFMITPEYPKHLGNLCIFSALNSNILNILQKCRTHCIFYLTKTRKINKCISCV